MTTTTKEAAARIRRELKTRYGYTGKDVSVRLESYSMGSSIHVKIRRSDIPLSRVESIARKAESIYRDDFGNILGGGNRYVSVDHDREARRAVAAPYIPMLENLEESDSTLYPILDGVFVGRRQWGRFDISIPKADTLSGTGRQLSPGACSIESAAYLIGANLLELSESA